MRRLAWGTTLDLLDSEPTGQLPESTVRVIARRMLTGLRNMHDANMVHRDLKPQNVAIRTKGEPESTVLIDYGAWLPVGACSRSAE